MQFIIVRATLYGDSFMDIIQPAIVKLSPRTKNSVWEMQ